jgi:hypothetical protein
MRKFVLLAVSIILLSLAACSRGPAGPGAKTDWIKLNGILYVSLLNTSYVAEPDLSFYDTIKRKNENVYRDGDASLLEAGTPVYSVAGYAPGFRLAAKQEQKLVIYQVSRNPDAKKGADLLDIEGKVERISVKEVDGAAELGSITERQQIEELVQLVLEAPVIDIVSQINSGAPEFTLSFHLLDGTEVGGFFWLNSGVLSPPGIELPEEFSDAILNARVVQLK